MGYKTWDRLVSPFPQKTGDHWGRSGSRSLPFLRQFGLFAVIGMDRFLRRQLHIREFTDQADCILRISMSPSRSTVRLPDGLEIRQGDLLLELHLWNEHLSPVGGVYTALAQGLYLIKRLRLSLNLLADYMEQDKEWAHVRAIHACFATCLHRPERAIQQLGFSIISPRRSFGRRTHDFFEEFLIYGLMWAFRPCDMKRKTGSLKRMELWISKAALLKTYGRPGMKYEELASSTTNSFPEACDLPDGSRPEVVAAM